MSHADSHDRAGDRARAAAAGLGAGAPGREIEGPMAIVILGGLFTSTMLNLLILPGLAQRYNQFVRSNKVDS